jgi:hypothetical protein
LIEINLMKGPYIIGATGGSGTRVAARIIRHGGVCLGTNLNLSEDAMDFGVFSDRWINRFVKADIEQRTKVLEREMKKDLESVLEKHLGIEVRRDHLRPWGWKEPRSIYLLPFWRRQFPSLKFLHIIRDGRDMAFSSNQQQLTKHGRVLLDWRERLMSRPSRSMLLWSRINTMAADYASQHLAGQYLPVRFEDLCAEPVREILRIFEFFELTGDAAAIARREVAPPVSLGRWRARHPEIVSGLQRMGEQALKRFGYLD